MYRAPIAKAIDHPFSCLLFFDPSSLSCGSSKIKRMRNTSRSGGPSCSNDMACQLGWPLVKRAISLLAAGTPRQIFNHLVARCICTCSASVKSLLAVHVAHLSSSNHFFFFFPRSPYYSVNFVFPIPFPHYQTRNLEITIKSKEKQKEKNYKDKKFHK